MNLSKLQLLLKMMERRCSVTKCVGGELEDAEWLKSNGLVCRQRIGEDRCRFHITQKGIAYVEYVFNLPMPETVYTMPPITPPQ